MSSYGKLETEKLRKILETQLDRLVQQLEDIEENRYDKEIMFIEDSFKINIFEFCNIYNLMKFLFLIEIY